MHAIAATGLSFSYPNGRTILNNLNFTIEAGETVILAGLSGCGKTTLCNLLCGICPQLIPGSVKGQIELLEKPISGRSVAQLAKQIGLVFQDSDNQLFCTTVEDELAFGLENQCMPPTEIANAIEEMLQHFHINDLRLADPGKLSGGQKKLVALAAVAILNPAIIILDEPLSGLDECGQNMVAAIIKERREAGQTMLIVEHDLQAITATLADRWLILANGELAAFDKPQALKNSRLLSDLELYYEY